MKHLVILVTAASLFVLSVPGAAPATPAGLLQEAPSPPERDTIPGDTIPGDTIQQEDEDTEEETEDGPAPYDEVIPDSAESQDGFFTVHEVDGDYFFEIPHEMLGREILLQTRVTRTATGAGFAGSREGMGVVRLERRDEQVLLRLVGHQNVAPDTLPIHQAVRNSNFEPIIHAFDLKTMPEDSASVVIDVTSFFKSDASIIGVNQSRREQYQLRGLQGDRTYIESVRSLPEHIEVRRTVTYSAGRAPSGSLGGFMSMELGHSLVLLPEEPMAAREWDERVGYFSVRQNDFGADAQRLVSRRFIQRWRLEPSDPVAYARGELVEPIEPITIYIDRATPETWRPYLKQGVEDWQQAFEDAGFRNAIVAKSAPTPEEDPDFDPADARVSMIRYLASPVQNASGPRFFDPRSGEILGTHIQWHHNVMNLLRNWYLVQTAAANPEARGVEFDDEVMGDLLRYVAAHEVGHALGLPHNMKGHSAIPVDSLRTEWACEHGTSTSIMDYARFNYIAQPGDDTCFIPRIGPYDRWSIEWGYRLVPEADDGSEGERDTLHRWIEERADDPLYRFGDPSAFDPGSTREALSSDPVRASDYGVANLRRIVPELTEWTFEEGEDYSQLREIYGEVVEQWSRYIDHVTLLIGGVDWTRRAQGQEGRPYTPVSGERQRAAIDYLDRQVFRTPAWMIDRDILYRIESTGIQDRIRRLQVDALDRTLDVDRLKRVIEQEALHGDEAYPLNEMLSDLRRAIWRELEEVTPIDPYRRNLQRAYLESMSRLLDDSRANATDITAVARGQLRIVAADVRAARDAFEDGMTELHLNDVVARIDRILDEDDD